MTNPAGIFGGIYYLVFFWSQFRNIFFGPYFPRLNPGLLNMISHLVPLSDGSWFQKRSDLESFPGHQ